MHNRTLCSSSTGSNHSLADDLLRVALVVDTVELGQGHLLCALEKVIATVSGHVPGRMQGSDCSVKLAKSTEGKRDPLDFKQGQNGCARDSVQA